MLKTKERGITLVALVITIVVLLILAGVALKLTVGDNGLIKRAQEAASKYKEAQNDEIAALNNISAEYDNIVNGNIGGDGEEEIIILPEIQDIQATSTTRSITVEVIATGVDRYVYSYKKIEENNYVVMAEQEGNIYTFEGLEDNTGYNIKVEGIRGSNKAEKEIEATTGEMPKAEGIIQFTGLAWGNGQASISITSTNTEYEIQYQINSDAEGNWTAGTKVSGLSLGNVVYARLWDGTNGGSSASITIAETTAPQVNIEIGQITTNSIQVSTSAIDNEAGMPEAPIYKYYIKKSSETDYPTTATYSGTETTYTFSGLTHNTEYDIKIEVADKAGNVGAIRSTNNKTIQVTSGSGAITFSAITWSSGKASISMSTTTSYTIQYQINSTTGTWTTGTTASGLSLGNVVNARLWDGTNAGDSVSTTITDTTVPNAATISLSSTSTNTSTAITATVTQSDSQSGVKAGASKWVYNTTSTAIGTNSSSYTGGTFSSTSQSLSLKATVPGTYYLHVLTVDNAGKARETISKAVTVKQLVTGITLSKTSTTLNVGATEKLTATIAPSNASNKSVTWSSSNTSVATVSGGTITAKAAGTATITATAADGSGKKATCTVTIIEQVNIYELGTINTTLAGGLTIKRSQDIYNSGWSGSGVLAFGTSHITVGVASRTKFSNTSSANRAIRFCY